MPVCHYKGDNKLIDYNDFCSSKDNSKTSLDNSLPIKNISVHSLKKLIDNEFDNIVLLDVRNPHENEINSINGSTLIPLETIQNGEAIALIRQLILNKQLYIHCKSGNRSLKDLKELRKYDIEGVNITGGIDAWIANKFSNDFIKTNSTNNQLLF